MVEPLGESNPDLRIASQFLSGCLHPQAAALSATIPAVHPCQTMFGEYCAHHVWPESQRLLTATDGCVRTSMVLRGHLGGTDGADSWAGSSRIRRRAFSVSALSAHWTFRQTQPTPGPADGSRCPPLVATCPVLRFPAALRGRQAAQFVQRPQSGTAARRSSNGTLVSPLYRTTPVLNRAPSLSRR